MKTDRFYDLWEFAEDEQRELLGTDIGSDVPTIVIELDERSMRRFYNRRFAPLQIFESDAEFKVAVHSIDDSSLRMIWDKSKMEVPPHEAREQIDTWLKRTGYFVNLKGFESFCEIFGKFTADYN